MILGRRFFFCILIALKCIKRLQHPKLALKIIQLQEADFQLRDRLIQRNELEKGYHKEMEQLHNQNAAILDQIIDDIGYPTIDKVGKAANEAAWLVIQHSIAQPDFMRKCAKLLAAAVENGQANPVNLAYLTDRIAIFENRLQQYGTQFDWDENGILSPQKYDDLIKVNQRRKTIGLNTIEEQTKIMRARAKKEHQTPPTDFKNRQDEIEQWKCQIGWIN